jgi:hypothetical protein
MPVNKQQVLIIVNVLECGDSCVLHILLLPVDICFATSRGSRTASLSQLLSKTIPIIIPDRIATIARIIENDVNLLFTLAWNPSWLTFTILAGASALLILGKHNETPMSSSPNTDERIIVNDHGYERKLMMNKPKSISR